MLHYVIRSAWHGYQMHFVHSTTAPVNRHKACQLLHAHALFGMYVAATHMPKSAVALLPLVLVLLLFMVWPSASYAMGNVCGDLVPVIGGRRVTTTQLAG